MKFMFSARSKEQDDEDYLSLEKQNLCAEWEQTGGEGNPQSPYKVKIRIQNLMEVKRTSVRIIKTRKANKLNTIVIIL